MSHVRYFLALCRTENFTLAANRCGVSQPSLTNAIKRFERDMGGPLFRRTATRTTLTELGQAIRPHLECLMQCAEAAYRAATTAKSPSQDWITTPNGGLNAQDRAIRRRHRGRRPGHNGIDQTVGSLDGTATGAAENLY